MLEGTCYMADEDYAPGSPLLVETLAFEEAQWPWNSWDWGSLCYVAVRPEQVFSGIWASLYLQELKQLRYEVPASSIHL